LIPILTKPVSLMARKSMIRLHWLPTLCQARKSFRIYWRNALALSQELLRPLIT